MDLLSLIKPEELANFTESYNYNFGFMGQKLFPQSKTNNIKVAYKQLVQNGDLPVMAQVHALDTEARIGDRTNFKELQLEKLFIKEKLDQGESLAYYLNDLGGSRADDAIVNYIFDDASNLLSRVITRTEVMNMELLSTGKITVKENNVDVSVDYGFDAGNKIVLKDWSNKAHDVIADIERVCNKARQQGWKVVRAITSSKVVGYLLNNEKINAYWATKTDPMTETRMLSWLKDNFGFEIVVNDDVYKTSANGTEQKRFYDEDKITFLGTVGTVGQGLFGVTPEELKLKETKKSSARLCTLTMWESEDPCTTWTKASGLYLPVMKNINKMFIATVK